MAKITIRAIATAQTKGDSAAWEEGIGWPTGDEDGNGRADDEGSSPEYVDGVPTDGPGNRDGTVGSVVWGPRGRGGEVVPVGKGTPLASPALQRKHKSMT